MQVISRLNLTKPAHANGIRPKMSGLFQVTTATMKCMDTEGNNEICGALIDDTGPYGTSVRVFK